MNVLVNGEVKTLTVMNLHNDVNLMDRLVSDSQYYENYYKELDMFVMSEKIYGRWAVVVDTLQMALQLPENKS